MNKIMIYLSNMHGKQGNFEQCLNIALDILNKRPFYIPSLINKAGALVSLKSPQLRLFYIHSSHLREYVCAACADSSLHTGRCATTLCTFLKSFAKTTQQRMCGNSLNLSHLVSKRYMGCNIMCVVKQSNV